MSKSRENLPQRLLEYTVVQDYSLYTEIDQAVWRHIMKISVPFFKKNAHNSYVNGLKMMNIPNNHIPRVDDMDKRLDNHDWGAVTVKGFIPPIVFMEFLSRKVLPIAVDMRTNEHITYTPAPDIIHEAAGHAPIIADPDYAEYLCSYGEIAQKGIQSKHDSELYKIIRKMSDMKENPNTDPTELKEIEDKFEKISQENHWVSEANELARMNWWTIEYGLVGSLDNPKIYGAGLLSSVSESSECLKGKVKKIPITIDCIHQDYNITEPQPQLFVTKDFKDLTGILLEYSETMAYKTGGISGVEKAILSENITTSVYDSGLQVSGTLTNFIKDNNKEMGYLNFGGAVQLSYNDSEIEGHGITYHSEGYGAAVGILSKINLPLHQLDNNQLESLGIKENSKILLNFIGGLIVSGTVKKVLMMDDSPILIRLDNCAIRLNDDYLYKPEWGAYDLACGSKIVSVFGGAADWDNYYKNKFSTSGSTHQSTNLNKENTKLNELYKQVRMLRKNNKPSSNYLPILKKLYDEHPDDWLLYAEIYEEIYSDPTLIGEKKLLKDHINKFAENKMLYDVINRFINLIEA